MAPTLITGAVVRQRGYARTAERVTMRIECPQVAGSRGEQPDKQERVVGDRTRVKTPPWVSIKKLDRHDAEADVSSMRHACYGRCKSCPPQQVRLRAWRGGRLGSILGFGAYVGGDDLRGDESVAEGRKSGESGRGRRGLGYASSSSRRDGDDDRSRR